MNYLFDLFGTLIKYDAVEFDRIFLECLGFNEKEYWNSIRDLISTSDFCSGDEFMEWASKKSRNDISLAGRDLFFSRLKKWKQSLTLYDSSLHVLQVLKRKAKIGIVSNSNFFIGKTAEEMGLSENTDFIVLSHKVGFCKPHKGIYEIALAKLDSNAGNVTFIGDQIKKDVEMPMSLGMNAILFDPDNKYISFTGERISSLNQIIKSGNSRY